MPTDEIKYSQNNGVYHIKLSRSQVQAFIAANQRNQQKQRPSINQFAKALAKEHGLLIQETEKIIVDFSDNNERVDLSNLDFSGVDLNGVKFSGANMAGCKFVNTILYKADFSSANLDSASFDHCTGINANFQEAQLDNVTINNSNFKKAIFTKSKSNNLIYNKSKLDAASLSEVEWKQAIITDSNLSSVNLDKSKIISLEIDHCNLSASSLKGVKVDNFRLNQSNLSQSTLNKMVVAKSCIITDSDLSGCLMEEAVLVSAEFHQVQLSNLKANKIKLHEAVIKPNCKINDADFNSADLSYADLRNCNFNNVALDKANLLKADLEGTNISRRRSGKKWYNPSSETLIKTATNVSKLTVHTAALASSGKSAASNMLSKLWGAQKAQNSADINLESSVANNINENHSAEHYKKVVDTINKTRLIAEDFTQAQKVVGNIIDVCIELFDQDYFFPRSNNYKDLMQQVDKAYDKGYIDVQYRDSMIYYMNNANYNTLPKNVLKNIITTNLTLDKIVNALEENRATNPILTNAIPKLDPSAAQDQAQKLKHYLVYHPVLKNIVPELGQISPDNIFTELQNKLVNKLESNVAENDKEILLILREIIPETITQEINKRNESKLDEMERYYVDKHISFTRYMLNERIEKLHKQGILTLDIKDNLIKKLYDKQHQFDEEINFILEKQILKFAANQLQPFLHVLSDPELWTVLKLLGSGQSQEETLTILSNLKENFLFKKLGLNNYIDILDPQLLEYIGIAPSIMSLIIPMMQYEEEFHTILSGLQDMFRQGEVSVFSDGSKRQNDSIKAITTILKLLHQEPALRRSFKEDAEKMTRVLANIFEKDIQNIGLEVKFINQLVTFAAKIMQDENKDICLLFVKIIELSQNPQEVIKSLSDQEGYDQLKNIIQLVLPNFIENQNGDIKLLIENFLMTTLKGSEINNQIAKILDIDPTKSLELQDSYIKLISSALKITGVTMNHQDEFLALMQVGQEILTGEKVEASQYLQAISYGLNLLQKEDVRKVIGQELTEIFAATNGVLENKIQSFGLSQEFAEQSVNLVGKIISGDKAQQILEFTQDILNVNIIESGADYKKILPNILQSLHDKTKYDKLTNIVKTSLPQLLKENDNNINALIAEFLGNTEQGSEINNQIAKILDIDSTKSLELKESYIKLISSALKITGSMMEHRTELLQLTKIGQEILTGEKVEASQYLQAISYGLNLLQKEDVRKVIGQELIEIFAATNGVLENKIKSFGLSQEFAKQSVSLVSNLLKSDEVGEILLFTNQLLQSATTLDKGKLTLNSSMNKLFTGVKDGNYKEAFQGFAELAGNSGKYKELKTLVQHTLPSLIDNNKDQIVPLMEEFIKKTELGKRINIDVNQILKIASEKNKNLINFAKYWSEGNYLGIVKETVKLLTSPMVTGFLLEIAGKALYSHLFKSNEVVGELVNNKGSISDSTKTRSFRDRVGHTNDPKNDKENNKETSSLPRH
ncbi:MAG: pentapeptide repeat-containing protein [Rickettsiaceae bacterium]|nr:pentapeptide repeat-containing protein [Rickettsiaceae bacterium]